MINNFSIALLADSQFPIRINLESEIDSEGEEEMTTSIIPSCLGLSEYMLIVLLESLITMHNLSSNRYIFIILLP